MRVRLLVLFVLIIAILALAGVALAGNQIYTAHLTGDNEVPSNLSQGQGQAFFRLNAGGTAIEYRLIAANIDNIFMSHIHNAPAGSNGPIVVWLYPDAPPAQLIVGPFHGVLAAGTIEAGDILAAGNLASVPAEARLNALLAEMAAGRTYVNVHTTDNDPATGPAPGDIPGGEIRGQIQ
ncbi:MAG: CHRD domain-containing protein [Nitrososphaerales archaeon]